MVRWLSLCVASIILSICLWCKYNNGKDAPLNSWIKKAVLGGVVAFAVISVFSFNIALGTTWQEALLAIGNNLLLAFFAVFLAFVFKNRMLF